MPYDIEILKKLYNSFDPMPLQAGDSAYMDCTKARGDVDIYQQIETDISWS